MNRAALEQLGEVITLEAVDQARDVRAHRENTGRDADYYKMAKVALGFINGATKLAATMENRRSNDLIERRLNALESGPSPKSLSDGSGE